MKWVYFISFLFLSSVITAQSSQQPIEPESRVFQPLSLPNQHRPLLASPAPLMTQKNIYYLILAVLLLVILGATIVLCWKMPSLIARILVLVAALGLSLFVAFVLLTAIGLTATPDDSEQGMARRDLLLMREQLAMSIETSALAFGDDACRIGLLLGEKAIAVVDYVDNRGLLAPYARIDSVIGHEGTAGILPPLPSAAADRWIIETKAARQSDDTTHLYQIEWHFSNISPSVIAVRYAQPDYFFPQVSSITSLCQHRIQEAR